MVTAGPEGQITRLVGIPASGVATGIAPRVPPGVITGIPTGIVAGVPPATCCPQPAIIALRITWADIVICPGAPVIALSIIGPLAGIGAVSPAPVVTRVVVGHNVGLRTGPHQSHQPQPPL